MNKPYAESCDQNREPIQRQLERYCATAKSVLEIGSGTGQHAVFFGQCFPHLIWQSSDLPENHAAIQAWINDCGLDNVLAPLSLDVKQADQWPDRNYDLVFTANSLHIMSEQSVAEFLRHVPGCMHDESVLLVYGPFNYDGRYTSESNRRFDQWLKQRDPASGIKHFEWIDEQARLSGLVCVDDVAMPANNRILVFRKLKPVNPD